MAMSNYPGGFMDGVSIRGVPVQMAHPGEVFFVNNGTVLAKGGIGGSNGNPGTYLKPFASIAYAVTRCVTGRGDIILVMPSHEEILDATTSLDIDKNAVAVIGLGSGKARPTISITTTGAKINITGSSVTLYNLSVIGSIDAIVSAILVDGDLCSLLNITLADITGQMTLGILTTDFAFGLLIDGLHYEGAAAAGCTAAITVDGVDQLEIRNSVIRGDFGTAAINFITTASTNVDIHDCYIWNKNAADVCIKDTITASTGKIGPNLNLMLTDNAANITEAVTGATFHLFDPVYVCNLAGEKAVLINWTASTDA